ncbi:MAG: urate hydroxylase PuuD, partial [Chloroflexota bacterium]|nr:urate hydroxylase PuuD [Chloroflexota bacterium]
MQAYALEWLNLLVRWLHVTAAVAWIGTSFYY